MSRRGSRNQRMSKAAGVRLATSAGDVFHVGEDVVVNPGEGDGNPETTSEGGGDPAGGAP